jgi:hypothetical protein
MTRQKYWAHSEPVSQQAEAGESQQECARDQWCSGYRLVPQDGGGSRREPGLSYQAFCGPDVALITGYLSAQGLPSAYGRLAAEIGDPPRAGTLIRVPFGPRMLLSEYYDMLMHRIRDALCSYEERVRTAASLAPLDTRHSSHRDGRLAVDQAARILSAHLSAFLALPPEPMLRHIPSAELTRTPWQDAVVLRRQDGMATLLGDFSGAEGGNEIFDLYRRCLSALGEVATQPEIFDGIPCRSCGVMGLERAEPPSDPKTEADYSRCPSFSCGDRMKLGTYRAWVARYTAWASSLGTLTCRRCENGTCEQCVYVGCECAAAGHWRAALTLSADHVTRRTWSLTCANATDQ